MTDSTSLRPAASDFGTEEDLRLVLESIRDLGVQGLDGIVVGRQRLSAGRAASLIEEAFGNSTSASASVSVYAGEAAGRIGISFSFDLARITGDLRRQVSVGIGKHQALMNILGGVPIEVSDRLDAARANPRLAAHLIATAADHLVWSLRLRLQETLAPIYEDGDTLSWSGAIALGDSTAWSRLGLILPLATTVTLDVPASMENFDV